MSDLNVNIRIFDCLMRQEYMYNLEAHQGELIPVRVLGMRGVPYETPTFWVRTSHGCLFSDVPVSALVQHAEAPSLPLDLLCPWNSCSYHPSYFEMDYLRGKPCRFFGKDHQWYSGTYIFSLDWSHEGISEVPHESDAHHFLRLDNGCFALQPNHRIHWLDSFTTEPFPERPDFKASHQIWNVEDQPKWQQSTPRHAEPATSSQGNGHKKAPVKA
ncbi:MAG: hypothetical protein ACO1RX_08805 [Candidatus Sericytochromatia bacterium]